MKFSEAFKLMKQGAKVKLPSWGGFWFWDPEKKTIIMHKLKNYVLSEGTVPGVDH